MKDFENTIYLLLGTNQGNRKAYLNKAKIEIKKLIGNINKISSVYETAAWGITEQPNFLNQVVQCQTELKPENLLKVCQKIENKLDRKRVLRWGQRTMDIDILYYENRIIHTDDLIVPHPEIQNRKFTLIPLAEIAKDFIHPSLKMNQKQLLNICSDTLEIQVYDMQ